ncbi:NAD(P)/FAD-dependent oxidoreductase [Ilumatobacter fluminis]|nr:FAD-dependent oxidoreductase [Ilumatobacter fluminis]
MPSPSRRSVWVDTLPDHERFAGGASMPPGDADVVIVGAGYTGLWTAWYLHERRPDLRVVVLEAEHVGFGASGRNGGWSSAILPMSLDAVAHRHGAAAAHRMQDAMHRTVDEIERFAVQHAADGVFHRGGTLDVARSAPQEERLREHLGEMHRHGFSDDDYRWLGRADTEARVRMTDAIGAVWTPHCGTVHPLRLVHALARTVASAGVGIVEGVRVESIEPGRVTTSHGTISADTVVRATEGYTSRLPGYRRDLLPIYSLMIATEPLPDAVWAEIGLAERPTFADGRHLIIYGQRTADGRFAFGGRGAPYHFGSRISPEFDHDDRIAELLSTSLRRLFPAISDAAITHHWGGVLAAPRDWHCAVRYDARTGMASAGGYAGDGVSTTNLAGRTLAALIGGEHGDGDDELVRLPWVGHRSRRWEPEPLRWLGVNAGRTAARRADESEAAHGRESRVWGRAMSLILGR